MSFLKTTTLRSDLPSNSFVVPFYLTGSPVNKTPKIRGRICRLIKPVTDILGRHNYPDSVNSTSYKMGLAKSGLEEFTELVYIDFPSERGDKIEEGDDLVIIERVKASRIENMKCADMTLAKLLSRALLERVLQT